MSWVVVGVAGAGAVLGGAQGNANRKQQKKEDAYRKAVIEHSPWTGMQDRGPVNAGPGVLGGALKGGMQGALLGSSLGSMGGGAATGGSAMAGGAGDAMDASGAGGMMQDPSMNAGGMGMNPFQRAMMMQNKMGMMQS